MAGLHSMTGFSRVEGAAGAVAWSWEIKSVNGRNLDQRIRLPSGYDRLDPLVRKAVAAALGRGSVSVNLSVRDQDTGAQVTVNHQVLDQVLAAIETVQQRLATDKPRPEGILGLRGVLEQTDDAGEAAAPDGLQSALLGSLDRALAELVAARRSEGENLRPVLEDQLARMAELADRAADVPGHQPEALREKLQSQIETVLADHRAVDPGRLHQEIALLIVKADVREEIDRLRSHCGTARELLAKGGPVGRRLDHLSQEFNREANTLCSKSSDVEMTGIGLELKALIDQFREQIQNLE